MWEEEDVFKQWFGSSGVKMKTGNNGIIPELVQKQEKIQMYKKYKNTLLVKWYTMNKEKSGGRTP